MSNPSPHSLDTLLEEFEKQFPVSHATGCESRFLTKDIADCDCGGRKEEERMKSFITQAYTLGVEAAKKEIEEIGEVNYDCDNCPEVKKQIDKALTSLKPKD